MSQECFGKPSNSRTVPRAFWRSFHAQTQFSRTLSPFALAQPRAALTNAPPPPQRESSHLTIYPRRHETSHRRKCGGSSRTPSVWNSWWRTGRARRRRKTSSSAAKLSRLMRGCKRVRHVLQFSRNQVHSRASRWLADVSGPASFEGHAPQPLTCTCCSMRALSLAHV